MNRRLLLLALSGVPAVKGLAVASQDEDEGRFRTTTGLYNGRSWNDSETSRIAFLSGALDGSWWTYWRSGYAKSSGSKTELPALRPPAHMTMADLRDGVTSFYKDPANLDISVLDAMQVFIDRANGMPQRDTEDYVAMLRREAASL